MDNMENLFVTCEMLIEDARKWHKRGESELVIGVLSNMLDYIDKYMERDRTKDDCDVGQPF